MVLESGTEGLGDVTSGRSSDTPSLARPDTLETNVTEHPFSFRDSPDKELNALIVEAVNRMGGVGDGRRGQLPTGLGGAPRSRR